MTDRVLLLIDADNVSLDVIEQAVPWVHKHYGGPHVRRAYCTAEQAVKHQGAFKRLSVRPMVNLAAGKNSTDIALAVDAIDLVIAELPQVVVIASSDSDFAPLVSRLREKGCRVVGIGQNGKTSAETQSVYDDYEVLVHHKLAAAPKPAARRAAKTVPVVAAAPPRPAAPATPASTHAAPSQPRASKVAAKKPAAARKTPARSGPPAPVADAAPADKARALLAALPELARGDELDLNVVAQRLRELKLLSKSGSSLKWLGQFGERFELTPAHKPNKVRLRSGA
jgi:NYN domain